MNAMNQEHYTHSLDGEPNIPHLYSFAMGTTGVALCFFFPLCSDFLFCFCNYYHFGEMVFIIMCEIRCI